MDLGSEVSRRRLETPTVVDLRPLPSEGRDIILPLQNVFIREEVLFFLLVGRTDDHIFDSVPLYFKENNELILIR